MASYNKVLLMGNLTRDVELRTIGSGNTVGRIGLAVNRHYTTQSGEKREETTFVDCEAWGRTAETMAKYLSKGRPVFIEGRLKLDQWEDKKDGTKKSKLSVVIDNFQFIDSRGGGQGGGQGGSGGEGWSRGGAPQPAGGSASDMPPDDGGQMAPGDDIPF
ncbi:MAG: single-stranded DNA-binding protein [Planctomycetes bacterium]|nr:single-stranded DNA-binding protein [Planctomycetota bacterium]